MSTTWVPAPPAADSFASRLRLLRLALDDATIEEMAKRCRVPAPTWRTWERGARPHGLDRVVQQITLATGVDRDWLMWGVNSDNGGGGSPAGDDDNTPPGLRSRPSTWETEVRPSVGELQVAA